jgi:hypothetical protein
LVKFASESLALYLWTKLAGDEHNPWHIGRERVGGETGSLSYHNAIIADSANPIIVTASSDSWRLMISPTPVARGYDAGRRSPVVYAGRRCCA